MTRLEEKYSDRSCRNSEDSCMQLKAATMTAISEAEIKMNKMLDDPIRPTK